MPGIDDDDHYAVLGLRRDASAEQIRDSYRSMARLLHPDRAPGDRAAARMARVNEAYYVLRDPGRRAVYDAARRGRTPPVPTSDPDLGAEPAPAPRPIVVSPDRARFPWRWVFIFAAVGSLLAGSLSVLVGPPDEPEPDNLLRIGSCVSIEANGDAREVACTEGDDLVVAVIVSFGETCPYGTTAHRDRQGLGIACVSPSPADENE